MIIFGLLSIIQMTFLPGILIVKLFKNIDRVIPKTIIVFGFSLIINFFMVFILSALHIYTKSLLLIFMLFELIAFVWLYRDNFFKSFEKTFTHFELWLKSQNTINLNDEINSSFLRCLEFLIYFLFLIFALTDIAWIARIFFDNFDTVFTTWDAILSWNHWATIWSQGNIPSNTQFYPQLIPTNWSLSYVMLNGNELQFFPKVIMPLFSFFILIMLFDLGLKSRSFGFFIGILFTRLIIKKFTGEYIADGYVDLPVAFFGFTSVYFLLLARINAVKEKNYQELIIAGLVLATGAALTKQAGLYVYLIYPALTYLIVFRGSNLELGQVNPKTLWKAFIIAFVLITSWYAFKLIQIRMGIDSSNFEYVTKDIYQGANLITRAENALILLGIYKYFLIALIPAVFLVKSPYRWPGVLIALPYTLIWLFYFSYEPRNLALIFPVWGMMVGLMVKQLFDWAIHFLNSIKVYKIPVGSIFAIVLLLFTILAIRYPLPSLLLKQEEKQWQLFDPELNEEIRKLVIENGINTKILTNYPVNYLPGLQDVQVSYWYDNLQDYKHSMEKMGIDYLLVPINIEPEVERQIQTDIQSGILKLLYSSDGSFSYRMYEKLD